METTVIIEDCTGHKMTWKKGEEATFKLKRHEYEIMNPKANNIGLANVIDPATEPNKLYPV